MYVIENSAPALFFKKNLQYISINITTNGMLRSLIIILSRKLIKFLDDSDQISDQYLNTLVDI